MHTLVECLFIFLFLFAFFIPYILHKFVKRWHLFDRDAYSMLLQDSRWKNKREKILTRDNYTCQWCGRRDNLQVHHKYYMKYPDGKMAEPWDYPDDKLITLCSRCHKRWHKKHKIKTYYRKFGEHYI